MGNQLDHGVRTVSPDEDRRLVLAGATAFLMAPTLEAATPAPAITVIELRQYTLHGGRRDELIALFERAFIEPQERVGAHVLGTFRDLDDPDRFVWLRGFRDMPARKIALEDFYCGPVWLAHRAAANATMVDSDNVLLLRQIRWRDDPDGPAHRSSASVIRIAIQSLRGVDPAAFEAFFAATVQPRIIAAGGHVLATLTTETSANNFPRLPVREKDSVFVWLARFPDVGTERTFSRRLAEASGWRDDAGDALLPALMEKPEILRLSPTRRSPFA